MGFFPEAATQEAQGDPDAPSPGLFYQFPGTLSVR